MELLEQIRNDSYCNYISDLKFSFRWKIGLRKILYREDIKKYSLLEWKNALIYLKGKDISIKDYKDVKIQIEDILSKN